MVISGSIMPRIATSQRIGSACSKSHSLGRSSPSWTITFAPSIRIAKEWSVATM